MQDRRLRGLVFVALCVILVDLGSRGWEQHQKIESELLRVRRSADALDAGIDGTNWLARARALQSEQTGLQARLWQVPSEAQAQARLRDWLDNALRSARVSRQAINLLPSVETSPRADAPGSAQTLGSAPSADNRGSGALPQSLTPRSLRARATISFELAPSALENTLVQIEAGGQLASVDNLSISSRNKRVEMTVSVPVLLKTPERP
jgi:hypothetical protein